MTYVAPAATRVYGTDVGGHYNPSTGGFGVYFGLLEKFEVMIGSEGVQFVGWDCTLFLHARQSDSGGQRLIAVTVTETQCPGDKPEDRELQFLSYSFQPGSLLHTPEVRCSSNQLLIIKLRRNDTFHVFAGQPNLDDLSRFTIGYEVEGQHGTLDGQLEHDDWVTLQVRDGPAKING